MAGATATKPRAMTFLLEDFNQPEQAADAADAPPPEATFSASELAAARMEAWNDGYLAARGANAGNAGREAQKASADLLTRSDALDKRLEEIAERNAASVARWLVATFVTAFPHLPHGSMAARTGIVASLLQSTLMSQSTIEVRGGEGPAVSCRTMYEVYRQIEARQIEDPSGSNIVIAWQQGEARLDPSRTWEDIRSAIMPLAAATAAETSFQLIVTPEDLNRHV